MQYLAWFGLLAPVIRLSLIFVLGLLEPGYSQTRDYISELGAVGASNAWLMNTLGTAVVGILLFGFSFSLWRALRPGVLVSAGSLMLGIAGVAFVGVGTFPCDPGCAIDDPSVTMQRHLRAGTLAMFAQTLAPITIGAGLAIRRQHTGLGWTSVLLGAAAVVALVALFSQGPSFPYPGALQKTFQVATDVWVFAAALVVLRLRKEQ